MALAVGAIWEFNASATASNVNGGAFNPTNANFLTDGTVDTNTGNTNSPVFSSASYNFVAGDVNAWLYVKSGTNCVAGWYKIASVASNKATLTATIGTAVQPNAALGYPTPLYAANTVAGIATVGTPTGITFSVDYSQNTAAIINGLTDFNAVGASTTLTSATAGFTPAMVGNTFHQTTTGTGAFGVVGWYEIVSYVNATTVVLDRSPNSGTASVNTTGYVGGAMSLNSTLDDDVFEAGTAGNRFFIKNGSYTLGETVSIGKIGTTVAPLIIEGYNTLRGDAPGFANQPTINCATFAFGTTGAYWQFYYLQIIGITNNMVAFGNYGRIVSCKLINNSTATPRSSLGVTTAGFVAIKNEVISYRGPAVALGSQTLDTFFGNYIHDSNVGINLPSDSGHYFSNNIISDNVTAAVSATTAFTQPNVFVNNTFYGAENKLGTGIILPTTSGVTFAMNNIFYGFTTGINYSTNVPLSNFELNNNYFNNTTDVTNWQKTTNDTAINPSFVNMAQLTGATATTSGSVLTQSGGDFSTVTNNVDFVYIVSGSGITAGKYLITSHTSTTITLDIAPGTNAVADKVWQITTGHNFAIGTALKATAYPGVFPGSLTTGYLDVGAAQRQEAGGGSNTYGS